MSLERISPIYFESVSAVTATPSVELGSRRADSSGNEYVYCYNTGNSQIVPTYGAILETSSSGHSVTITIVTGAAAGHVFVGVIKHATITTGAYGWVMSKGFASLESSVDSTLTGAQYLALKADGTFNSLLSAQTGVLQEQLIGISDADADTASGGSFVGRIFSGF